MGRCRERKRGRLKAWVIMVRCFGNGDEGWDRGEGGELGECFVFVRERNMRRGRRMFWNESVA